MKRHRHTSEQIVRLNAGRVGVGERTVDRAASKMPYNPRHIVREKTESSALPSI